VWNEVAMSPLMYSDDELRAMYAGGHGNRTARRFARAWAVVLGSGLAPRRWVTLEVPGRRSHRITRFPLGMADWNGEWYLVSMLGENCNWVQNVRAADGHVVLRHGVRRRCRLIEIPPAERAPIIKRYVAKVPGGRPHIPADRRAPIDEFVTIADRYPVFRVERDPSGAERGRVSAIWGAATGAAHSRHGHRHAPIPYAEAGVVRRPATSRSVPAGDLSRRRGLHRVQHLVRRHVHVDVRTPIGRHNATPRARRRLRPPERGMTTC
jgi:hypothetical protein